MPRATQHYRAPWLNNEPVIGLVRCADGRWRYYTPEGKEVKFSEADPKKAVARFQAANGPVPAPTVRLSAPFVNANVRPSVEVSATVDGVSTTIERALEHAVIEATLPEVQGKDIRIGYDIPEGAVWAWLQEQYAERPAYVDAMLGKARAASLSLDKVRTLYLERHHGKPKSKSETVNVFDRMVKFTGAKTLADLAVEALTKWKDEDVEKTVEQPSTREKYYSRVKTVIGFGLKVGLDEEQVQACLARMKVLWTAGKKRGVNPTPISRADFRKLLEVGGEKWRPWLLVGLNCCMHLDEVCQIRWDQIDMKAGTYCAIRGKTEADEIPRAAVLWPETVEAITKLYKPNNIYVFTSSHGTRYNRNTRGNDFSELRECLTTRDKRGGKVTFDWLRDGAYTAARKVSREAARILAGHSTDGYEANYVLNAPEETKPATDAVYKVYGPFPSP